MTREMNAFDKDTVKYLETAIVKIKEGKPFAYHIVVMPIDETGHGCEPLAFHSMPGTVQQDTAGLFVGTILNLTFKHFKASGFTFANFVKFIQMSEKFLTKDLEGYETHERQKN